MQSIMKVENKSNAHTYTVFVAAILISGATLTHGWSHQLRVADTTINNIRVEAKTLDADSQRTEAEKEAIWTNQMKPAYDEAVLHETAAPVSGSILIFATCIGLWLIISKRVRAKIEQMSATAKKNEYSHLRALTWALAMAAPITLVALATTFDFKIAVYAVSFWAAFVYTSLAPLKFRKA